jgi:hypothetical protein
MTDTEREAGVPMSRDMAIRQQGGKRSPVARRLRLLRSSLFGEDCTQFARRVGISTQRMNNFENGYPLSIEAANRICAVVPGMSLDWLYRGDERALPMVMLDKLRSGSEKPSGAD